MDYPTKARRPANSRLPSAKFASVFGWDAADWRQSTEALVRRVPKSGKTDRRLLQRESTSHKREARTSYHLPNPHARFLSGGARAPDIDLPRSRACCLRLPRGEYKSVSNPERGGFAKKAHKHQNGQTVATGFKIQGCADIVWDSNFFQQQERLQSKVTMTDDIGLRPPMG
nr:sugar nucleotide-binding protein [Mesorhizobium sp. B2-5-9]